ncbi:hypothetical protein BDP81DRAFT_423335 [Colletotrichum phormii]|uniref:Uncharacterized protein n=1 Tax=Colletotrichum phormii TaxID=359342 RepID=A0AAJ0EJH8_9PEZI|nr:uncharacterized protein BDP81DRAFT_423335 [Colletotrichum phormii]KAK1639056.1 hypothetical protein BDP81DRAFT_423335 [Colletotrichum phormii]
MSNRPARPRKTNSVLLLTPRMRAPKMEHPSTAPKDHQMMPTYTSNSRPRKVNMSWDGSWDCDQ